MQEIQGNKFNVFKDKFVEIKTDEFHKVSQNITFNNVFVD